MGRVLSRNFHYSEFACRCDPPCETKFKVDPHLIHALQGVRDAIGIPLRVSSGCRCYKRNKLTPGAAKRSFHVPRDGVLMAADIMPLDPTMRNIRMALALYALAAQHPLVGGLGLYTNRIHVDTRPVGILTGQDRARWIHKDVRLTDVYKA